MLTHVLKSVELMGERRGVELGNFSTGSTFVVKTLNENNTITDGGVAPRCSFAGPT